jgi:hypothetical protein
MSDSTSPYLPEEELDTTSKKSYLAWISHRLGLPKPLSCDPKNGNLSTENLSELAKQILRFKIGASVASEEHVNGIVREMYAAENEKNPNGKNPLAFSSRKSWSQYTKNQYGVVIGSALSFTFEGDPHIGSGNGVIYKPFLEEIYAALPQGNTDKTEQTLDGYNAVSLASRKTEAKTLAELYEMLQRGKSEDPETAKLGTMVPEYQRSDQQWKDPEWNKFIDSVLRKIPMPSIVLGKAIQHLDQPWQVIDGNQRISTIRRWFDDTDGDHDKFRAKWFLGGEPPEWFNSRLADYHFTVEKVVAKSDRHLAELYERYNASGKPMSQPQLRVAKHHEISALHHLLLAISGGPTLLHRPAVRTRLGISEDIDVKAERAAALRNLLPNIGKVTEDERRQLRRVTEKVYDLWCRIVAYCNYKKVANVDNSPTAKNAIETVFSHYRHGNRAIPLIDRLDYVVRECSSVDGDFAFLSLRAVVSKDERDEHGDPLTLFVAGKSVHGWATQVQCAALWSLTDDDISLLKRNPDTFQSEWYEFAKKEIALERQNSKSIWNKQEMWETRVSEILHDLKMNLLEDEDSEEYVRLMAEVQRVIMMPAETRHYVTDGWAAPLYSEEQIEFMYNQVENLR